MCHSVPPVLYIYVFLCKNMSLSSIIFFKVIAIIIIEDANHGQIFSEDLQVLGWEQSLKAGSWSVHCNW